MRVGLALRDSAIGLVALKGQRVVHALAIEGQENPAAVLKAEVDSRRIPRRRARVGLSRSLTVVKVLELPAAAEGSLGQMVAFELERHVPFPPEELCFDFARLPPVKGRPIEVLVSAVERRTVDGVLRLLDEARVQPITLTVSAHDLLALLGRPVRIGRFAWIHRAGDEVSLLFLENRRLGLSRSVPWAGPEILAGEIRKSLTLLRWSDLDALWLSGDGSRVPETALALRELGPVTPPPFSRAAARAIGKLGDSESGLTLLALAVALGPRRPPANLLPEARRPRQVTVGQVATVISAALAVLFGLGLIFARGHQDQRYLAQLNQAIRALDPEVRAGERLGAELDRKRRFLATIKSLEESTLRPLPLLRELTDLIPADAWVTTLNLDAKGVELTGQAGAANQLIPLLENSPRLEKVEFASPVTKARDKEQFRIRATWEARPKPVSTPRSQGAASR